MGMDDTVCIGYMKYFSLDLRSELMGDSIRNISKHRSTDINHSIFKCKQTFDIHRVLIGHYLCQ